MANSKSSIKKLHLVRESVKALCVRSGVQTGAAVAPSPRIAPQPSLASNDPNSYAAPVQD